MKIAAVAMSYIPDGGLKLSSQKTQLVCFNLFLQVAKYGEQ